MAVFALNPRVWVVLGTLFLLVLALRVTRGWLGDLRRRWATTSARPQSLKDP